MRIFASSLVALALASAVGSVHAGEPAAAPYAEPASTPEDRAAATDQATTPLPIKTQIAFKPSYTFPNGADRYKAEILFEPLLPYRAFAIPGLEVDDFWSVARIQLSSLSQQNTEGAAAGIGDLTLTDLVAHHLGPLDAGLGFATVFPMATTPALGKGKWQVGPAAAGRLQMQPFKAAVLVQNFYSVAGDSQSADLAYVTVQPFLTLYVPADVFLTSSATMSFYWRGGKSTAPVDLGVGHAFGSHFVGQLEFWYTLAGSGQGAIKMQAVLNFQP